MHLKTINETGASSGKASRNDPPNRAILPEDIRRMMGRYGYSDDTRRIVERERLLPAGLLSRIHAQYPQHSNLLETGKFPFCGQERYSGKSGFKKVVEVLRRNGIEIGFVKERETFIDLYRFLATKHVLNAIDWSDFEKDPLFQLVVPQPGMIDAETTKAYVGAKTAEERERVVADYRRRTNPHDGNQQLNKPWFENDAGRVEFVEGSQHKYPQCQLVFDESTQSCFAFCTYCFRHAQVRGDEDMFLQKEITQVHDYLRLHGEVTDLLLTGGDAGYMPAARFERYVAPIVTDADLLHIRTIRLASRALTYLPEMILSSKYDRMLALFDRLEEHGIQTVWMAHFSTPRELLNPSTIAAVRRLQAHGVVVKSQSPMMNRVSLFMDDEGRVDIDRSAQNWIDLGNLLATLKIGFHSMYCARPTGEYHYFTAPLADMERIFSKVYRSLASINRPSRYLSMSLSAGKIAILGTVEVHGEKAFVLKFTESRNMKWMDRVFLAKYNDSKNSIALLQPFDSERYFFEEELREIETALQETLEKRESQANSP